MIEAPVLEKLHTVYAHRHEWAVLVEYAPCAEFPYGLEPQAIAVCIKQECGERMTREQIEFILNHVTRMNSFPGEFDESEL